MRLADESGLIDASHYSTGILMVIVRLSMMHGQVLPEMRLLLRSVMMNGRAIPKADFYMTYCLRPSSPAGRCQTDILSTSPHLLFPIVVTQFITALRRRRMSKAMSCLYIGLRKIPSLPTVPRGLNEVRGAHDDEQQSAHREVCAAGCASREGARRNVRPDAPNKNYTYVEWEQKTNNKISIIAIQKKCTVYSTLITVKFLDDLINIKVGIFRNFFAKRYRNIRGAHFVVVVV